MSAFELALPVTAEFEGSIFTNDPDDPGGPTKCGITLAWARENHLDIDHDGDIDVEDIRALTWDLAAPAYRSRIWNPLMLYRMTEQKVATKIFDLCVNLGGGINPETNRIMPSRGVRYFQRACNICGYTLKEDGLLGPLTRDAINQSLMDKLLHEVIFLQRTHYNAWCDSKPGREKYRRGLLRRANWPYEV